MESLKVPKGSANKTSIPVAIRFNANEESVEDVTKPCDSLSSSPIHGNSDDSNWRKDFLQGTFFSRKRSGSSENVAAQTSSPSGSLPTSNEGQSVGTWKLIKGRVSQAMEDIKSSKTDSVKTDLNGDDSDVDSATINSSISDDFNEAVVFHSTTPVNQPLSRANNTESESELDVDSETLAETDSANLRKSYSGKRQSTAHTILSKIGKTKEECRSAGKSVLRRRKRRSKSPVRPKDIEIESGVEITEEMSLSTVASDVKNDFGKKRTNDDREMLTDSTPPTTDAILPPNLDANTDSTATTKSLFRHAFNHRGIVFVALAALSGWTFSIPPFIQGVLACLCCTILFSKFCEAIVAFIDQRLSTSLNGGDNSAGTCVPERGSFAIPNYATMPVCRVPPVEEHKQLKTYSGWMNQINNYDPTNYHISMTRSVFVKLDGSKLTLSSTNARVPKRSMWNEQIDRKTITFTQRSCYDLTGAHIEMCPKGLARKRYFSRKYPIQLIIKNISSNTEPLQDDPKSNGESESSPTKDFKIETKRVSSLVHQSSNESVTATDDKSASNDLGSVIMLSDLQILQDRLDATSEHQSVPCGDDIRILLFARCDREKEDWYRRFTSASVGTIVDQEFQFPDMVMVNDDDVAAAVKAAALANQERDSIESTDGPTTPADGVSNATAPTKSDCESAECVKCSRSDSVFEGLLLTSCAARGPADYVRFMTRFQKACTLKSIPVIRAYPSESPNKKNRRERKQEDELWKGIDQSLYLGPSGSVVWANVLVGRILFSCLNDAQLLDHIQEFLQRKLSSIRLPNFMEEVQIAQVNLGDTPPLIHRVSQPLLDERGTWVDADVTYEGLVHMTITTKLNLLRLKRQQHHGVDSVSKQSPTPSVSSMPEKYCSSGDAIYDSNAESSGASSSESDSPTQTNAENLADQQSFGQGSSKKFLRIVDRITASNLFQSAAEIPYIQKAMENMNTKIRLRVELKGLVARCVLNIPPPPSDRIWMGFRGPPRLWISATPAVGDHTFDWTIVTNAIESKLCDEVSKYLVYPNMVDLIAPFLGHSTYRE
ncbi:hypothetical protein HA402_002634 [Bradysia odoriphaga]|nr:hypothetical protein HA402_002634 [Bradysia odoriphaga]